MSAEMSTSAARSGTFLDRGQTSRTRVLPGDPTARNSDGGKPVDIWAVMSGGTITSELLAKAGLV
jgi:hypothetical protein